MANNPNPPVQSTPFTKEQFQQMKVMLNETIPMQEDNLRRAELSGLDVTVLKQQLQASKDNLTKIINAWKDKY